MLINIIYRNQIYLVLLLTHMLRKNHREKKGLLRKGPTKNASIFNKFKIIDIIIWNMIQSNYIE